MRGVETARLRLRPIERNDLPRLTELLNDWGLARWLSVLPFPFTLKQAEALYAESASACFLGIENKSEGLLIGGVSLNPPRHSPLIEGEIELGFWLSPAFQGQGLMREAITAAISIGFSTLRVPALGATTLPSNKAAQAVLRQTGFQDLGLIPRTYPALRGDDTVTRWLLVREADALPFGEKV